MPNSTEKDSIWKNLGETRLSRRVVTIGLETATVLCGPVNRWRLQGSARLEAPPLRQCGRVAALPHVFSWACFKLAL
jgi:hypothetical protein